jgi:hypothetical protein
MRIKLSRAIRPGGDSVVAVVRTIVSSRRDDYRNQSALALGRRGSLRVTVGFIAQFRLVPGQHALMARFLAEDAVERAGLPVGVMRPRQVANSLYCTQFHSQFRRYLRWTAGLSRSRDVKRWTASVAYDCGRGRRKRARLVKPGSTDLRFQRFVWFVAPRDGGC